MKAAVAHDDVRYDLLIETAINDAEAQCVRVGGEQRERIYVRYVRYFGRAAVAIVDVIARRN